ncbi:hypothetical protein [Bradyrhizobium canariense]|nr:hypothetical protein [Bradyrhizobium canariense]
MTAAPPLYDQHEVLARLQLRGFDLEGLLNVGLTAPMAGSTSDEPRYCIETIDHLAAPTQRTRLADALSWDFELQRPSYMPPGAPWARSVGPAFYPFAACW